MKNIINYSGQEAINAVQEDGMALQHVKYQTEELCRLAIQQTGWALRHVKNRTAELCKLAMQQDDWALRYFDRPIFDDFGGEILC